MSALFITSGRGLLPDYHRSYRERVNLATKYLPLKSGVTGTGNTCAEQILPRIAYLCKKLVLDQVELQKLMQKILSQIPQ